VARFGATLTVENEDGKARRYRIVGVDEADPRRGWISWRSPIAGALTGRRVGDTAVVHTPHGDEELTVVAIDYE
jgi:transcription elongation factor GreB